MLNTSKKLYYWIGLMAFLLTIIPPSVNAQSNQIPAQDILISDGNTLTIPDFENMDSKSLNRYLNYYQSSITSNPQFRDIPLLDVNLPKQNFAPKLIGQVDNYYSNCEQVNPNIPPNYYVTGTVTCGGRNKIVVPTSGQKLAYLELTNGQRWMSGQQLVNGGCGILKSINNGQEPAGRLVYGTDALKIVLTGVDETTETATFNAYLRICANLPLGRTCTPYFIPIPWFNVRGNNWIALGGGLPM